MFNRIKVKLLTEVIDRLDVLFHELEHTAAIIRNVNEDNDFEISVCVGVRKALEEVVKVRDKYK